jgi:hypothetical protein
VNKAPAPVLSFVLVALMCLPFPLYVFFVLPIRRLHEGDMGQFMDLLVGLLIILPFHLLGAVVLPVCLYYRRKLSSAHKVAYYASVCVLVAFIILIWKVQLMNRLGF